MNEEAKIDIPVAQAAAAALSYAAAARLTPTWLISWFGQVPMTH